MEFTKRELLETLMSVEHLRVTSEAKCIKDPTDSDSLTKWGAALMLLAQFGDPGSYETRKQLREAVLKLEEALTINPANHEALWFLGRTHTYSARITGDYGEAKILIDEAFQCFQKAVDESPETEYYQQSLAECAATLEFFREHHERLAATSNATGFANLKYYIGGSVILVGLLTWIHLVK